MNFWQKLIAWLNGLFSRGSNHPDRMKQRAWKELEKRQQKIHTYKNALAGLIARQRKLIVAVEKATKEVERVENLKHAAAISTRGLVSELKGEGLDSTQIRADARYTRNLLGFQQLSTQGERLRDDITRHESQIRDLAPSIEQHKTVIRELIDQQQQLQRDLKAALSDIRDAEAERQVYEQMAVVESEPLVLKELEELRHKARAEARVAKDSVEIRSALESLEASDEVSDDASEFGAMVGL